MCAEVRKNPPHEIPDFSHDRMSTLIVSNYLSLIYLAFSSTTLPLGTTWEFASCISATRSLARWCRSLPAIADCPTAGLFPDVGH
jgi:hypothetical protein